MDNDDLFGGGFGTTRQQPFSFDEQDMNPFGDGNSPWTDANTQVGSAAASPTANTALNAAASDSSPASDSEEPNDGDSDDVSRLHQDVASKLRVSNDAPHINEPHIKEPEADEADAQLGKLAEAGRKATSAPHSARRVGVIKRGLRSPRVLGKQLSPASFEDPLTSAAAAGADFVDPLGSRASIDVSPSAQRLQASAQQSRQTRSLSETRPGNSMQPANYTQGADNTLAVSLPPAHPHPYDQQLSPPLQHEQLVSAREHVDGSRRASLERPSTASAASRSSAVSRTYLGTHQRRRSLEPTPADQIPAMDIAVTDPVKVSDALKSYIAYKVHTRSDAAMFRERDMVVRRRYRDFDWLIQELAARHAGVIVPAIPEKQSMGRFGDEFVEARRAGLESCLARIGRHPVLWNDDVFRLFLEADDFATKARLITETRVAAEISGTAQAAGSGLFGGAKYKEKDEWFARRMQELDAIEEELRALLRALDYSQRQRRELSIAHGELGEAYLKMAGQELSKGLANGLTDMGSLQQKLKVLQGRQGVADFAAFQLTTDEYIRMIGAVRSAFAARGRAHTQWQANLGELLKRRKILEGFVQHPGRASAERLTQLKGEIARAEIRTETSRNAFDDVSQILKQEIVRFDAARVRDFQAAIETYLTSLIDTQEEIVVLWEAYLATLRSNNN
ncbi:Vacuolar protein sorting-associated protein vps5 [Coemansia erecta]|nr:Vacuolar protein sorting-associated protein vps5 [Coemansia sp. RSA 2618]KAJ2829721.1 Vacuolar protein sorting-associated protein vps5 [Coemansia erecta]